MIFGDHILDASDNADDKGDDPRPPAGQGIVT